MAAAAKAVSTRPFVTAGSARRAFTPDVFLAPLAPVAGGDKAAAGSSAAVATKPWRSGGPPKKVSIGRGRCDL
jgi:hypothetical protein